MSCQAVKHLFVVINELPKSGVVFLTSNRTFISGDK